MAQYLILIYEDEAGYAGADPGVYQEVMDAHNRFAEQAGAALVGGNALRETATATSIRGDVVTDGPFVETKEVLAGVYVLEARDLDHALACAKLTPVVEGGVEVRPLVDFQVVAD
jgi:hypothetical protein